METISGTVRLWTIRTCLDLYYSTHYCHTLRCNKPDMEIYKSIHINRSLNVPERNRFTTQIWYLSRNYPRGEASRSLQYLINGSSNNILTTSADKYVISLFCSQL